MSVVVQCSRLREENLANPRNRFEFIEGGGRNGDTFVDQLTGHRVKEIDLRRERAKPREIRSEEEAYKTCVAMKRGVGPDVYGAYKDEYDHVFISMKNMEMGDLENILLDSYRHGKRLDSEIDDALVKLFHEFENAKAPFCHQDLHWNNIAFTRVNGNLVAKAIDFGIASLDEDCRISGFSKLFSDISGARNRLPNFYKLLVDNGVGDILTPEKAPRPNREISSSAMNSLRRRL